MCIKEKRVRDNNIKKKKTENRRRGRSLFEVRVDFLTLVNARHASSRGYRSSNTLIHRDTIRR